MLLLGYDVGSSSVKASIVDSGTGRCLASSFFPKNEAPILSVKSGWAEQDPQMWWDNLRLATADVLSRLKDLGACASSIGAIGISYQMHGLVCVDKDMRLLRPAIIWCDSRAVPYGNSAFSELGGQWCLEHLLNSPGNFTAAKLAWVRDNEPEIFSRIYKIMLPGDYIAMRLGGEICTTVSGLSEGIFWDFKEGRVSERLMSQFGFGMELLPEIRPVFAEQGRVTAAAAAELGLKEGTPVTYRAGDQPNNALSLGVFEPGEIASTAGTSGVVYGVLGKVGYDPQSRVNTFAHVNHTPEQIRLGVLLCINGTGILNSWVRRNIVPEGLSYSDMNSIADGIPVGSEGISILPFGNGAERVLGNREIGCRISGLDFNRHNWRHLVRAEQEGIVFSFKYGMEVMEGMGMDISRIHAGKANMFLNPVFRETLAAVSGAVIELYDTDGAAGAARGAGMGAGVYRDHYEAFSSLERLELIRPGRRTEYLEAYARWKELLSRNL